MVSAGPVDIFVDIAELGRVTQELSALITALVDLGSRNMIHADTASMGSRDVAAAVNRFVDDWDTGRQRITENLQACQKFAEMAVDHYGRTEGALLNVLQPASTNGSTSP